MTSTIYANDLKLKSDHLDVCRTNCAKFHSNRSSSFVERVVTDRQTDRHTDTQTHARTHTRLRFLPRDNHNTFSPLKKTEFQKCIIKKKLLHFLLLLLIYISPPKRRGPNLEVLQDQVNPWQRRSKPLSLHLGSKISLISKPPYRGRIRY